MLPTTAGQVVKFHTTFPNEDPNQCYVVLEMFTDVEKPRAHIKAITTDDYLNPINVVLVEDLEIVDIKNK